MWETVTSFFAKFPAQEKVAKLLVDQGMRVVNGRVYSGDVEISTTAIARAVKVDRRVVTSTVRTVMRTPKLRELLSRLSPSYNLKDVAEVMGWGVLEIILSDPSKPGTLGRIATTIGESGISIRQAVGEDPEYSGGRLFIITEKPLPGEVISRIRGVVGVERLIIH